MMERAMGLVLRTRPLTETSLIVHWLTPGFGRVATVAKGARRPKSPFRGKLDLFYQLDFTFVRSARSELHTLREITLLETNSFMRQDLTALEQACYCAALVEQATETETPLPVVFELFYSFLRQLSLQPGSPHLVLAFELKLLGELGLEPAVESRDFNLGTQHVMRTLASEGWSLLAHLRLSKPQFEQVQQFLHGFLNYHLGRIPGNRENALRTAERAGAGKPMGEN